jgi:hypothetical protein
VPEETIDPITKPLPDPVCDLPKEVPASVSDDKSVKKPDCVMEPDPTLPPVAKDPIITKPLPDPVCDLPKKTRSLWRIPVSDIKRLLASPVCALPKDFSSPALDHNLSGILPINDPAALDALRNNLNLIAPNAPIATAWVSPVSTTQSSTMQSLLGLVDPTNERSAMLRDFATTHK